MTGVLPSGFGTGSTGNGTVGKPTAGVLTSAVPFTGYATRLRAKNVGAAIGTLMMVVGRFAW